MTVRQEPSDDRIDSLERKVDLLVQKVDEGFRRIDERFEQVDKRFEHVDKRFEQVDKRFEQVDKRFERLETGLRDLRGEMTIRFERSDDRFYAFQRTMFVFYSAVVAGLIGIIATQL